MLKGGNFYHVYNRGVDKRDVFMEERDYFRFLASLKEFNCEKPVGSLLLKRERNYKHKNLEYGEKLVQIIAYCLNRNHYHLLLQELIEGGRAEFLKRLGGYTSYFNQKYKRSGTLFQGKTKKIKVNSGNRLWFLSAYINGNPEIHGICPAEEWPWSSYGYYFGIKNKCICDKRLILENFKDINEYKNYLSTVIQETISLRKEQKKYILE